MTIATWAYSALSHRQLESLGCQGDWPPTPGIKRTAGATAYAQRRCRALCLGSHAERLRPITVGRTGERGSMNGTADAVSEVFAAAVRRIEGKVSFLETLYRNSRKDEALALCCLYIEGLARIIYFSSSKRAERDSKKYFVKALQEHGGEPQLRLVHPLTLIESLKGCGTRHSELAAALESHLVDPASEPLTVEELVDKVKDDLNSEQRSLLEENVWIGTLAAVAYKELRSTLVHHISGPGGLVFGDPRAPRARVSFHNLYGALCRIVKRAEEVIMSTFANPQGLETEVGEASAPNTSAAPDGNRKMRGRRR